MDIRSYIIHQTDPSDTTAVLYSQTSLPTPPPPRPSAPSTSLLHARGGGDRKSASAAGRVLSGGRERGHRYVGIVRPDMMVDLAGGREVREGGRGSVWVAGMEESQAFLRRRCLCKLTHGEILA